MAVFPHDELNDNEYVLIKHAEYARLNVQETDETTGKMGLILTCVVCGTGFRCLLWWRDWILI